MSYSFPMALGLLRIYLQTILIRYQNLRLALQAHSHLNVGPHLQGYPMI